jgi:hypothetical protein
MKLIECINFRQHKRLNWLQHVVVLWMFVDPKRENTLKSVKLPIQTSLVFPSDETCCCFMRPYISSTPSPLVILKMKNYRRSIVSIPTFDRPILYTAIIK